jgi:transcription termination/antitermination protein NusA
MAAIQRSEFALALNQIATERGIDPQVVIDTIKGAILAAYKKDFPDSEEITEETQDLYMVDLNEGTGETKIFKEGKDITPPGFGRIAAQTAKQVLLQKIREKEKDAVISEYSKRIGTIANAMILRFAGPNIICDIGKAEAVMEPNDKMPNEQYFLNKKMAVYIREIDDEKREIMVSRSHPGLIEGLLKREVPEVNSGSVVVKKVVREPGNRAKIAVYSEQSGIDPVGSCVGQKGVRIQAIIDSLDGIEKIDVIQWSPDIVKLITNSLSPAKDLTVEVDEKKKKAIVVASHEELPLVIGRDGQNVRLASKLSEYEIEVEGREEDIKAAKEESEKDLAVEESKKEDLSVEDANKAEKAEENLGSNKAKKGEIKTKDVESPNIDEKKAEEKNEEFAQGADDKKIE